jgi:PAS domain S-box-containing protein
VTQPRGWAHTRLRTKALIILAIPIVPLLISSLVIVYVARHEREAQRRVARTLEIKTVLATLNGVSIDTEAAVKHFLLTRTAHGLERYSRAGAAWPGAFEQLATLSADNLIQVEHIENIRALIKRRALAVLVEDARTRPADAGPPIELLNAAHTTLSAVRAEIAMMQEVEDGRLTGYLATSRRTAARLNAATLFGALLGICGSIVAAVAFSREFTRRLDEVHADGLRLLKGEPLAPSSTAADELGTLSRQLHEVWSVLRARIDETNAARAELDKFFTLSLDMLCITDNSGYFKRINPAWEHTLGLSTEELLTRPYRDLMHPDDVPDTNAARAHVAAGELVHLENRYQCKDGSYRWLSWRAAGRGEDGLVFATARDITEQKRRDAELEARLLESKELNEELEAFSYSVSHDLRAPLRHITGFLSLLEASAAAKLTEQERRWLALSVQAGHRMGRLIDDLLSFSRMSRAPVASARVRLDQIVADARAEVGNGIPEQRHIEWRVDRLPEVLGDAGLLRQAFVNLIGNAVKYTRDRSDPCIEVGTLARDNGQVVVFVRDNGVGFDMQYAHKLFGVFQRLHDIEQFDGTGIGLANVRRIVARHGGRTWAEGAVNHGATFFVSLPPSPEGAVA